MKKESVEIQKEMSEAAASRTATYCNLVIGKHGFWSILKYELVMLFSSNVPGALGIWLRSRLYPTLLGSCGKNVFFGVNTVLRHPHKIHIGDNVVIDDNCLLDAKGRDNRGIDIGAGCFVGRNSILSCKNGDISLGDKVNIGFNCEVFSGSSVALGEKTLVAAYCYFVGGDHDTDDPDAPVTDQGRTSRGIRVGSNCWFGAGVKVLDGRSIGNDTTIGAGAVVSKDIPGNSVAVGVPAKVTRKRVQK